MTGGAALRFAALAVLASCAKAGTPAAPAQSTTCATDAECQAGLRCDASRKRCVCTGDASCGAGKFCNAFTGACVDSVPGCHSDADCPSAQFCSAASRSCEARRGFCAPCLGDEECGGGGRYCVAHPQAPALGRFCGAPCNAAGGCDQSGLACLDASGGHKQCLPASGSCTGSGACTPDSGAPCQADAGCNDALQVCDQTLGRCVAKARTCASGQSCDPQTLKCVAACATDGDCSSASLRCIAGSCVQAAPCAADADCQSGRVCLKPAGATEGQCGPGCAGDADCGLGALCSGGDHPACVPGCRADADCALNERCGSSGQCEGCSAASCSACQATAACPVMDECANGACVAQDLSAWCGAGDCAGASMQPCTVAGAAGTCLPAFFGDCSRTACPHGSTCASIGGQRLCTFTVCAKTCADDSACAPRGMGCDTFGANGEFRACFPNEPAGIDACARAR